MSDKYNPKIEKTTKKAIIIIRTSIRHLYTCLIGYFQYLMYCHIRIIRNSSSSRFVMHYFIGKNHVMPTFASNLIIIIIFLIKYVVYLINQFQTRPFIIIIIYVWKITPFT